MDLEKQPARGREPDGCLVVALRLPVRIVVFVLIVPVRMVWDALVVAGRFLRDAVLRPLGRALMWPVLALWRYVLVPLGRVLVWLGNALVVVPLLWLYQYVLTPLGKAVAVTLAWLYARVLAPFGHAVMGVLVPLARVLLVLPALALWRWVLVPVGRVLVVVAREAGDALGHAWRVASRVSLAVGRALGTLVRWIFVEPVRWFWRTVLTPVGHVVRDVLLRPAAAVARGVGRVARAALAGARESVRQARADLRRMLFGEPERVELTARREPPGRETRTLGSSTTALTKD
jgi:hypothetical protein